MQKYPRVLLHIDGQNSKPSGTARPKIRSVFDELPPPEHRAGRRVGASSASVGRGGGMNHRWANRRKIDFAELVEESWVLPRTDSWNYICIADAFRTRGLSGPKIGLWSNDASVRTHLVAAGQFVTAMGKLNAEWCGMKVLPINLAVQPWPVVIATLKRRTLSPVVELFIEFVRQITKPMRRTLQKSKPLP